MGSEEVMPRKRIELLPVYASTIAGKRFSWLVMTWRVTSAAAWTSSRLGMTALYAGRGGR